MGLAWDGRDALRRGFGVTLLLFACAALTAGQGLPKLQSLAPPRAIILPPSAIAGEQATLAVLDAQGRLVPNIAVELSGGRKVTTNATGRALFTVPDVRGKLAAKISGSAVSASAPVEAPENPGERKAPALGSSGAKVISYPRVVAIHDRFTIAGSGFGGAADSNRVFLADELCVVLASSPNSLVILPGPRVPVGDVTLRLIVDGRNAGQFPVSAALVEIAGPAETPNAGATGTLTLRVRGTTERATVEIRNSSPDVVRLLKGNVQRVKTSGGDDNVAPVDAKFVSPGNYAVSARLIPTEAGQPDVESIRKRLLQARELASGIWSARIDRLLLKIDTAPVDLAQVRAEIKSLLDDKPAASLASLLDSAWRELQQNN